MSNEKLEALKWRLGTVNRFEGSQAVDGPKGELFGRSWATCQTMACGFVVTHNDQITAAHALGVEEGKRCAPEAAPVDDGKKWRIMVGPANCTPVLSDAYAAEYSTADKDAILRANELNASRLGYTARLVEPKHVHVWTEWEDAGNKLGRACRTCPSRQVAEWKDES